MILVAYPSSDIQLPKCLNSLTGSTCWSSCYDAYFQHNHIQCQLSVHCLGLVFGPLALCCPACIACVLADCTCSIDTCQLWTARKSWTVDSLRWHDRRESLWTAGRFNLRQIKMETGYQVRMHVRNLLETADDQREIWNVQILFLLCPGKRATYCDQFVCLCVCLSVHEHISGTAGPIFTKFCVQVPCGRGSVLLWRRCDTLCTSGFMDDVTFGLSGLYSDMEGWTFNLLSLVVLWSVAESDVYEYLVSSALTATNDYLGWQTTNELYWVSVPVLTSPTWCITSALSDIRHSTSYNKHQSNTITDNQGQFVSYSNRQYTHTYILF